MLGAFAVVRVSASALISVLVSVLDSTLGFVSDSALGAEAEATTLSAAASFSSWSSSDWTSTFCLLARPPPVRADRLRTLAFGATGLGL